MFLTFISELLSFQTLRIASSSATHGPAQDRRQPEELGLDQLISLRYRINGLPGWSAATSAPR